MINQTQSFYNKFSFLYPLVDQFLKKQKRMLFTEINRLPYGHLLDIGVGNGSNLPFYQTHKIVGIDTSEKMLATAKKRSGNAVELYQMDGEKLLFPKERFDYVVLSHVVAVVNNPEKVMEEVFRVLKPNGKVFILNHFTPDNWLQYIDKFFGSFSRAFHFKSVFYLADIVQTKQFSVLQEKSVSPLAYFKLVILEKA